MDFYENGEVDPLVIIREYKSYPKFLASVEAETFSNVFSDQEMLTLEYLSKTILSGVRPHELMIMRELLEKDRIVVEELTEELNALNQNTLHSNVLNSNTLYPNRLDADVMAADTLKSAIWVLQGGFVSKEEERRKYSCIEILEPNQEGN